MPGMPSAHLSRDTDIEIASAGPTGVVLGGCGDLNSGT
jgi:hypothetical protein